MAAWTFLRSSVSAPATPAELEAAPAILRAKDYLPTLYPVLFSPLDLPPLSRRQPWCSVAIPVAAQRLRRFGEQASRHPAFAALAEASEPLADWIDQSAPNTLLTLDLRELSAMTGGGTLVSLPRAAAAFSRLTNLWSEAGAATLLPSFFNADPNTQAIAACRWTRLNLPRAAFFAVAFGWPDAPASLERWQPWFEAGPPRLEVPTPAAEAQRLRNLLTTSGIARFSNEPNDQLWIERYLTAALRDPNPETLAAILDTMLARALILSLKPDLPTLTELLAAFQQPA
jgi:hypothetical protein